MKLQEATIRDLRAEKQGLESFFRWASVSDGREKREKR